MTMRRCSGNNTEEWNFEAIFEKVCPNCDMMVAFFKDEMKRNCPRCNESILNDKDDQGCG